MSARVFLWGKLPAHGDFVARGLIFSQRESLDLWLSDELQAAREALGEDFERRYDEAPPWRFVCREDGGMAGAMAPSIDSVGRRYPLLVGRAGLSGMLADDLAEACEEAVYQALEAGWTADRLVEEVGHAKCGAVPATGEPDRDRWWTSGGENYSSDEVTGVRPGGLMRRILARAAGAPE